jgi:hypothetical protein
MDRRPKTSPTGDFRTKLKLKKISGGSWRQPLSAVNILSEHLQASSIVVARHLHHRLRESPAATVRHQMHGPGKEFLDIQILHIQRILFDKLAPRFHILTHQRGKDGFALSDIFQLHR